MEGSHPQQKAAPVEAVHSSEGQAEIPQFDGAHDDYDSPHEEDPAADAADGPVGEGSQGSLVLQSPCPYMVITAL